MEKELENKLNKFPPRLRETLIESFPDEKELGEFLEAFWKLEEKRISRVEEGIKALSGD